MTDQDQRIGHFGALFLIVGGYIFGLGLIAFRRWSIEYDGMANWAMQTLVIALLPTIFALLIPWIIKVPFRMVMRDRMLWGVFGAVLLNWFYRASHNTFWIAVGFAALLLAIWWNLLTNRRLVIIIIAMTAVIAWLIAPRIRELPIKPLFDTQLFYASMLGIVWTIFSAPLLAWSVSNQGPTVSIIRRGFAPRWLYALVSVVVIAWSGWIVTRHGLQNCEWLDRALDRSGCYAVIPFEDTNEILQVSSDGMIYAISYKFVTKVDPRAEQASVIYRLPDPKHGFITYATLSPDASILALTT